MILYRNIPHGDGNSYLSQITIQPSFNCNSHPSRGRKPDLQYSRLNILLQLTPLTGTETIRRVNARPMRLIPLQLTPLTGTERQFVHTYTLFFLCITYPTRGRTHGKPADFSIRNHCTSHPSRGRKQAASFNLLAKCNSRLQPCCTYHMQF